MRQLGTVIAPFMLAVFDTKNPVPSLQRDMAHDLGRATEAAVELWIFRCASLQDLFASGKLTASCVRLARLRVSVTM